MPSRERAVVSTRLASSSAQNYFRLQQKPQRYQLPFACYLYVGDRSASEQLHATVGRG
jgi:hypothetical protein